MKNILSIPQLAIMSVMADSAPKIWCLRAAIKLHCVMLKRILRSPMDFFDCTPIGRIIARFSKDVNVLDIDLPWILYSFEFCLFSVNLKKLNFKKNLSNSKFKCNEISFTTILQVNAKNCD